MPDRFGNTLRCPSLEEPITVAIFANGVYEPDTVAGILRRLPMNGVYLDVGANIGAIALPVARQRPDVRVICIEADPGLATVLRRNIADNALTNITVAECLAGSCSREAVRFYTAPPDRFGMGSVGPQFERPPILLGQVALDELIDDMGIDNVDVIKLDVEGSELGVLQGLTARHKLSCIR
jgi:FkbM family methyltransferase